MLNKCRPRFLFYLIFGGKQKGHWISPHALYSFLSQTERLMSKNQNKLMKKNSAIHLYNS